MTRKLIVEVFLEILTYPVQMPLLLHANSRQILCQHSRPIHHALARVLSIEPRSLGLPFAENEGHRDPLQPDLRPVGFRLVVLPCYASDVYAAFFLLRFLAGDGTDRPDVAEVEQYQTLSFRGLGGLRRFAPDCGCHLPADSVAFRGLGCAACGPGLLGAGRTGAEELLVERT